MSEHAMSDRPAEERTCAYKFDRYEIRNAMRSTCDKPREHPIHTVFLGHPFTEPSSPAPVETPHERAIRNLGRAEDQRAAIVERETPKAEPTPERCAGCDRVRADASRYCCDRCADGKATYEHSRTCVPLFLESAPEQPEPLTMWERHTCDGRPTPQCAACWAQAYEPLNAYRAEIEHLKEVIATNAALRDRLREIGGIAKHLADDDSATFGEFVQGVQRIKELATKEMEKV